MTADDIIRIIDTTLEHHGLLVGVILFIWAMR
jgi:hypothetical protein